MPKGETVADYAALSLEEVLEEYESLISDERKHETNLKRETFRAAMALSERYAKLEMGRKVLKYCDAALESVPHWVPAHLMKAEARLERYQSCRLHPKGKPRTGSAHTPGYLPERQVA